MQDFETLPEGLIEPSENKYHKVTIEETKTQVAELLEAVLRGEDVFIIKDERFTFQIDLIATDMVETIAVTPKKCQSELNNTLIKSWSDLWMSEDFHGHEELVLTRQVTRHIRGKIFQ